MAIAATEVKIKQEITAGYSGKVNIFIKFFHSKYFISVRLYNVICTLNNVR